MRITIEEALKDALASAAATEDMIADDLSCVRDYSVACPSGTQFQRTTFTEAALELHDAGWVDVGDGLTCSVSCSRKRARDKHGTYLRHR